MLIASCTTAADNTAQILVDDTSTSQATSATSVDASHATGATSLIVRGDWGTVLEAAGVVGTVAIREIGADHTLVWNPDRARERRRPVSTFKILNSLIILETGVLADVDTVVPWDDVEREIAVWNSDHTLRSGIKVSAVWLYQDLARQVGPERMMDWIQRAEYGNETLGGEIDNFWLTGELRISPLEQIDFLENMVTGELPFRPDVTAAVSEIIVQERGPGWSWSYKTGTSPAEGPDLGWLVGITEQGEQQWVFALNLDLESVDGSQSQVDPKLRQEIARTILGMAGALPT